MQAHLDRLYQDVAFLTELRPYRNYRNLGALAKVCDYIEGVYHGLGLATERQCWTALGHEYTNVITSYNPHKKKRLVVGAHYDVCGDQSGADDNASAVAGLLETVRLVTANQPKIDYRIDFVAYCLEEPPFFGTEDMGSYVHARALHEAGADVMGMICFEMIGYFSDAPNSQPFPSPELASLYPSTANFIIVVGIEEYREFNQRVHELMGHGSAIDVQVIHFPGPESLAGLSDHSSYWRFGYPALMINDTSFIRNPHYHEVTDTIETLDFKKMSAVVDSSYRAVVGL